MLLFNYVLLLVREHEKGHKLETGECNSSNCVRIKWILVHDIDLLTLMWSSQLLNVTTVGTIMVLDCIDPVSMIRPSNFYCMVGNQQFHTFWLSECGLHLIQSLCVW